MMRWKSVALAAMAFSLAGAFGCQQEPTEPVVDPITEPGNGYETEPLPPAATPEPGEFGEPPAETRRVPVESPQLPQEQSPQVPEPSPQRP